MLSKCHSLQEKKSKGNAFENILLQFYVLSKIIFVKAHRIIRI